jgi:hypothetical protein
MAKTKKEKTYCLGELFCGPGGIALGASNAKVNDLARRNMAAADCPLATVTLENIRRAIQRKRALAPRGPRF